MVLIKMENKYQSRIDKILTDVAGGRTRRRSLVLLEKSAKYLNCTKRKRF